MCLTNFGTAPTMLMQLLQETLVRQIIRVQQKSMKQ